MGELPYTDTHYGTARIIGLVDSPKVFRDTAQQTKAFIDAVEHKVYKEEKKHDN